MKNKNDSTQDERGVFIRFRTSDQKKLAKKKAIDLNISLQDLVVESVEKCYPDVK